MKPSTFDYHLPHDLDETLRLLDQFADDAKLLAGGQSLMPLMNFRLTAPAHLVDINQVSQLAYHRIEESTVRLGALTRVCTLERDAELAVVCPLLGQAAPFIAHPQIRTRGTVGGSLAHADPAAELPGIMVALGATMHLRSLRGRRSVTAEEFFQYQLTTVIEPDELLVEVEIPQPSARTGSSFKEIAARHGDFAIAGVAAVVTVDERGFISTARVTCISAGPRPMLIAELDELVTGVDAIGPELAEEIIATVSAAIDPPDELRASAAYKRRATGALARDAITQALQRARQNEG